jgi:TolA-binding protein
MLRIRAHFSWLVRGHKHVGAALNDLGQDLRDLQQKVGELDTALVDMRNYVNMRLDEVSLKLNNSIEEQQLARNTCDAAAADLDQRIAAVQTGLGAAQSAYDIATDDLAERIAVIHSRLP